MWQVQILEIESMQVVESFKPVYRVEDAERVARGVNVNLNKSKYMTDIVYLGEDLSCL